MEKSCFLLCQSYSCSSNEAELLTCQTSAFILQCPLKTHGSGQCSHRNPWFEQCFLYSALCALKWPLFTVYTSLASKAQFQISFSCYLSCICTIRVEKALKMCLPCALQKRQYCSYKHSLSVSFVTHSFSLFLCLPVCFSILVLAPTDIHSMHHIAYWLLTIIRLFLFNLHYC